MKKYFLLSLVLTICSFQLTANPTSDVQLLEEAKIVKPSPAVTRITSMQDLQRVIANESVPLYIEFYSTHCPPCKKLSPKFEKYAEQYANTLAREKAFFMVNVDELPEAISAFNIRSVPTLLVFEKQKEKRRKVSLQDIMKFLQNPA